MNLNGQTITFSLRHDADKEQGGVAQFASPAQVLVALVADYDDWDQDCEEVGGKLPADYMCAWYTISMTVDGVLQCDVPGATFFRLAHEHGFVDAWDNVVMHEMQSSESIALAWAMLEQGVAPTRV